MVPPGHPIYLTSPSDTLTGGSNRLVQSKESREKGKIKKTKVGYRAPAALPVPSQNTTISSEIGFSDLKMPLLKSMGFTFCENLSH